MSLPILQLANRLANAATSSDRISCLSDLQSYAKKNCAEVGEHTLQMVVDLLKENGEPDEYTEALDLISRLVNPKYGNAASINAAILLADVKTVELLLDLLEHEDGLVAVMASEILTSIHSLESDCLENMIQMCPAGMTKLLNRVPDRSREEVSNQAIILIQQLTVSNEEMKKAVAFNEGFDTLFGIIESEGGVSDPGAVVQDCLQICCNVLSDSETCQRLFFEMGGGWHFKLLDFFSPEVLENVLARRKSLLEHGKEDEDMEDSAQILWFEHPVRLNCAIFSVKALLASFGTPSSASTVSKGKMAVVSSSADEILRACAHWLIRGGPRELLPHCFSLIVKMVLSVDFLAARMFDILLKYEKTARGMHAPVNLSTLPHLHFNWSSSSASDTMMISLSCLLADRYIYPCTSWIANGPRGGDDAVEEEDEEHVVALHSLRVLNTMLQRDEMSSGMVLQHILAPPPPDEFHDDLAMTSGESSLHMEFGSAVFTTLVKSLCLIVESPDGGGGVNQSTKLHVDIAMRASNILSLIFIHGGMLASELSTALSTSHLADTTFSSSASGGSAHQPILPYLLSMVSRLVRLPGVGYTLASAVLRLLSAAASGCERASRQMLEDPSNLFVIELASRSSENAGVSQHLQVMCCLFLGCVFESFGESSSAIESDSLSRNSILGMIDAKIGLSRFNDLIKIPMTVAAQSSRLQHSDGRNSAFSFTSSPQDAYFVEAYQEFYKGQVHSIKTAIYGFYAGSGDASAESGSSSSESKIIQMQIETIADLELKLKELQSSLNGTGSAVGEVENNVQSDEKVSSLEAAIAEKEKDIERMAANATLLQERVQSLNSQISDLTERNAFLSNKQVSGEEDASNRLLELQHRLETTEAIANKLEAENRSLLDKEKNLVVDETPFQNILSQKDAEIVLLKEEVLSLVDVKKAMTDEADAAKRRLRLLEEDLKSPMPFEKMNENKITELEKRNTDLKTQLWEMESTMKSMQTAFTSESSSIRTAIFNLVDLLGADEEVGDRQNLSQCVAGCVDIICRVSGHCSDIAESFDIHFDSIEDKPMERVAECINKLSDSLRCDQMKILEGERFRNQLAAAEDELDRLKEDYDTAFSRLDKVEEDNTTLQVENTRLKSELQCAQAEVTLLDAVKQDLESKIQIIVEMEVKLVEFENQNTQLSAQNVEFAESLQKMEQSIASEREEFELKKDLTSIEINRLMYEVNELRAVSSERTDVDNKLTEMTVELNHYKGECTRLEEDNAAHLAFNSKLSEEYAQLQAECDEAKKDLECAESEEAMLDELRADFRHLAVQADLLQHQKKETEDALAAKEVALTTTIAEKQELQHSLTAKAEEYNSLLANFISQKEEMLTLTAKADQLSAQMEERVNRGEAELDVDSSAAGQIAGLNDVIKGLELEIDEMCTEKETLSSYYTAELQRLRDEVEKLSSLTDNKNEESAAEKLLKNTLDKGTSHGAIRDNEITPDIVESLSSRLVALSALWTTSGGIFQIEPHFIVPSDKIISPQDDALPATLLAMDQYLNELTQHVKLTAPLNQKPHFPPHIYSTPSGAHTPVKGGGTFSGTGAAVALDNGHCAASSPATVRESVRLHADLRKERSRLHSLQDQHTDLLGLLAQQEIELQIYRQSLSDIGGPTACSRAEKDASVVVTERYGSYVNFRDSNENVML